MPAGPFAIPAIPPEVLQTLSQITTPVIIGLFVIHLLYFFWLIGWARRDERRMVADFEAFTRDLRHRSVL